MSVAERCSLLLANKLRYPNKPDKYPGGIITRFKHSTAQWQRAAKQVKLDLKLRRKVHGWKPAVLPVKIPVVNVEDAGCLDAQSIEISIEPDELPKPSRSVKVKEALQAIKETDEFLKGLKLLRLKCK